jgi:hypothetical protein
MPAYHGLQGSKDKKDDKWVTVGGRKINLAEEDVEDKLSEKPESLRGAKESNTKEARKSFIKRHNIKKTLFKLRDNVMFDEYTKSGIVYALEGDYVKILAKNNSYYEKHVSDVFKTNELTIFGHWDTMPLTKRIEILKLGNVSKDYMNTDWYWLSENVRKAILKAQSPNGMDGQGGFNSSTEGVWNPVNEEKTVQERIDEEKVKPKESKSDEK